MENLENLLSSNQASLNMLNERLSEGFAGIKETILSSTTFVSSASPTSSNVTSSLFHSFKYPKTQQTDKREVIKIIKANHPELSTEEIDSLYRKLCEAARQVCQTFSLLPNNKVTPWREVDLFSKQALVETAARKAFLNEAELEFLQDCEGYWPMESCVKACWVNKSKRIRKLDKR